MTSSVLPIVLSVLCGLFLYVLAQFVYHRWQLRKFPGPESFPLIGCCYDFGIFTFYRHLINLRKRYGKVFCFFTFHKPWLVICDPVIARRILSDPKTFFKGEDYTTFFSYAFGKGLVTSNGDDHKKGRAVLGKYFIRQSVSKYADVMNFIVKKAMQSFLVEEVAASSENAKSFNIEAFFAKLALRCFMKFSCDVDCSLDPKFESEFCHLVSKSSHAVSMMIFLKEPYMSMFPHANTLMHFNVACKNYFESCVAQRKDRLAKGESFDDPLSALLEDESLSEKDRFDHFKTLICAGHDTTAFFLSYCVYCLAKYPEVQQRLYDEIQERFSNQETISADDIKDFKYINYVMMETLRMYPIIPNVTRECNENVHLKDENVNIVIPKNITIIIPLIVMHKDSDMWEDSNKFMPSRFENKQSSDYTSAKDGFFPFAYGSRTCIGNTLAQMESGIALVHLMRQFVFEEDPSFKPSIRGGISLTTSNGVHVILKARK